MRKKTQHKGEGGKGDTIQDLQLYILDRLGVLAEKGTSPGWGGTQREAAAGSQGRAGEGSGMETRGPWWAGEVQVSVTPSLLISRLCYAEQCCWREGGADLTGMHSFGNSAGFTGDFRRTCKFRLHMKVVLDTTPSQSQLYFCLYLLALVKEQSLAC